MGADASKSGSRSKGIPILAKKNILNRWRNRQAPAQLFAVARHDERADGIFATLNGTRWTQTEDFLEWPFDPPLSNAGIEGARENAMRVREMAQRSGCPIHVVISSPYYRCIQTAVEYCIAFGPRARLLVDRSLGEIYGPDVMGPTEPGATVRPIEHTRAYCKSRGVTCIGNVLGRWPRWPEQVTIARNRYANRFLTYLQRGSVTRRNFLLVTHADCVGTAVSLMPSHAEHAVETVEYGGLFVAQRKGRKARKDGAQKSSCRSSQRDSFASIIPAQEEAEAPGTPTLDVEDFDSPTLLTPSSAGSHNNWVDECTGTLSDCNVDAQMDEELELPQASDGWEVSTLNIRLRKKVGPSGAFSKRVKKLATGGNFSREHIKKLLGELSSKPLGGTEHEVDKSRLVEELQADDRARTQQSLPLSSISFSTFLFGASDIGNMSDIGSGSREASLNDMGDVLDNMMAAFSPERVSRRTTRNLSRRSLSSTVESPRFTPEKCSRKNTAPADGQISPRISSSSSLNNHIKHLADQLSNKFTSNSSTNSAYLNAPVSPMPSGGSEQPTDEGQQYPIRITSRCIVGVVEETLIEADGTVSQVQRAMTNPVQVQQLQVAKPTVIEKAEKALLEEEKKPPLLLKNGIGSQLMERRRQMKTKNGTNIDRIEQSLPFGVVQECKEEPVGWQRLQK